MYHQLVSCSPVHWHRWVEVRLNSSASGGVERGVSQSCLYTDQCLQITFFSGLLSKLQGENLGPSESLNSPMCLPTSPSLPIFSSLPFSFPPQTGLRFVAQQTGIKPFTLQHPPLRGWCADTPGVRKKPFSIADLSGAFL